MGNGLVCLQKTPPHHDDLDVFEALDDTPSLGEDVMQQVNAMIAAQVAHEAAAERELEAVLEMSRVSALPTPPPYESSTSTAPVSSSLTTTVICTKSPGGGVEATKTEVDNMSDVADKSEAAAEEEEGDITCSICCDEQPAENFKVLVEGKCKHPHSMCQACVVRFINEEVNGKGNVGVIQCPHDGCGLKLEYSDVKKHAGPLDFDVYEQVLIKQSLQAMAEFRWCSKAGCGSGQLVEGADANPIMTCHHCSHRTCFHHRIEWHSGKTCAMYDQDMGQSEEAQLVHWMEQNAKRCPSCSAGIEKNDGCDHMTCKRSAGGCGAEFCWRCGADYNGPQGIRAIGNTAHARSCMWYK